MRKQVDMHQEIFLDTTMTCMHCCFFEEELSNAIGMIQRENANLHWALNSVNQSLQYMNDPIQLTGSVSHWWNNEILNQESR